MIAQVWVKLKNLFTREIKLNFDSLLIKQKQVLVLGELEICLCRDRNYCLEKEDASGLFCGIPTDVEEDFC